MHQITQRFCHQQFKTITKTGLKNGDVFRIMERSKKKRMVDQVR